MIDPGHGGYDPGAQGYVSEEVVVLDIALRLRDALEAQGINVILSREGDYHLDERKATDLAARAAMATTDRNLFVSIHANAAESSTANGIETWVFGEPLEEDLIQNAITENGGGSLGLELTEEAKQVHDSVLNDIFRQEQLHYSMTLAEAVQNAMIEATDARDRGIRKNYFYVIRNARIPAVLVEVGFVSNPAEGRNLGRADYRARIADWYCRRYRGIFRTRRGIGQPLMGVLYIFLHMFVRLLLRSGLRFKFMSKLVSKLVFASLGGFYGGLCIGALEPAPQSVVK